MTMEKWLTAVRERYAPNYSWNSLYLGKFNVIKTWFIESTIHEFSQHLSFVRKWKFCTMNLSHGLPDIFSLSREYSTGHASTCMAVN